MNRIISNIMKERTFELHFRINNANLRYESEAYIDTRIQQKQKKQLTVDIQKNKFKRNR